jgi:L-threonylcarbamoyladenylate synthase
MKRLTLAAILESPLALEELRELLRCDGIVAIPTETFYGFGVDPRRPSAIERLFSVKGRAAEKGLPVLISSRADLDRLGVDAPPEVIDRFFALWPAPLTVVFATRGSVACSGGDRSVAVRVPNHAGLRQILDRVGPLTGTSANFAGQPPLSDPNEVALAFSAAIDLLIDAGPTPGHRPSTLVDARFDPPRLLREGAYPWPA